MVVAVACLFARLEPKLPGLTMALRTVALPGCAVRWLTGVRAGEAASVTTGKGSWVRV